jgi:hypothetical protein
MIFKELDQPTKAFNVASQIFLPMLRFPEGLQEQYQSVSCPTTTPVILQGLSIFQAPGKIRDDRPRKHHECSALGSRQDTSCTTYIQIDLQQSMNLLHLIVFIPPPRISPAVREISGAAS